MAANISLRRGFSPPEGVWDDFEAPPLLDEQTFEKVRGLGRPPVRDRYAQVGDASFEVVREAGDRAGQLGLEVGDHAGGELASDGARRGLVVRTSTRSIRRSYGKYRKTRVSPISRNSASGTREASSWWSKRLKNWMRWVMAAAPYLRLVSAPASMNASFIAR
jgi:hypothetical protein